MAVRSNLNLTALFGAGSIGSWVAAHSRALTHSYKWTFLYNALAFAVVAITALFKYLFIDRPQNLRELRRQKIIAENN